MPHSAEGLATATVGAGINLLSFPPEIILLILDCLTRVDIKRSRLVCKAFQELSVGRLFSAIHISPHEKDMVVFDAITRRPDLNASVSVIYFVTARFIQEPTIEQYCRALSAQLQTKAFSHLRATDTAFQRQLQVQLLDGPEGMTLYDDDDAFLQGYQDYVHMAKEHSNLFTQEWFARVLHGLKALGPIDRVVFQNTFDIYYEIDTYDDELYGVVEPEALLGKGVYTGPECSHSDSIARIRKRPVGSPSSRSWPLSNLQPTYPVLGNRDTSANQIAINSQKGGSVEFTRAVELLKLAEKKPDALCYGYSPRSPHVQDSIYGLPPQIFAVQHWWGQTKMVDICKDLTVLELEFGSYCDQVEQQSHPLHQLRSLFQSTSTLECLHLVFPGDEPLYRYQDIFPPIMGWEIPTLREFGLQCVATQYKDLNGLLFFALPNMDELSLEGIRLVDGEWGSMAEGLWRLRSLPDCNLTCPEYIDRSQYYVGDYDNPSTDELSDFDAKLGNYISQKHHVSSLDNLLEKDNRLSMDRFTATYNDLLELQSKKKKNTEQLEKA
ncbi:MAG: hypothetical protein Q9226_006708 [Calogaya cf. arnoldii]